jgi:hypothetical protein
MKRALFIIFFGLCFVTGCFAGNEGDRKDADVTGESMPTRNDAVVWPDATNAIRFRIFTNASPDASHVFNTFEIEAYGERLLSSPTGDSLKRLLVVSPTNTSLHSILVNGAGPELAPASGMTVIESASGPEWRYLALDATPAYRGRLEQYRRSILFVSPDLFVLHDHLVARAAASFQMLLHPPAATRLDPIWHDLRLDQPNAGLRINAPSRRVLRAWEQIQSAADSILPGTMTMKLGPTNQLAQLDLLTVFAVCRGGETKDYAFKLVESNNAVGARIHREGFPTLVAFKTALSASQASLDGFPFTGPVGVSVFRPRPKIGGRPE